MNDKTKLAETAKLKHVAQWVKQIADACRPTAEPMSKDKLASYAFFLSPDFPLQAFTLASAATIAKGHDFLPSVSVLHKHLGEWWSHNRPPEPLQLTGPGSERLDPASRALAKAYFASKAAGHAEGCGLTGTLSWMRRHDGAFRYIVANDPDAATIARYKGWMPDREPEDDWNPDGIRRSVALIRSGTRQDFYGEMLGRIVANRKPENLGHVPPQWHPTVIEGAAEIAAAC